MSYLPVLFALSVAERPLSQTELAHAARVEQPSMAETVGRMVRDGLVHCEPNPSDKRGTMVSLTRLARARFPKARAALLDAERVAMAGLSHAEQRTLVDLLKRVSRSLETSGDVAPATRATRDRKPRAPSEAASAR